MSVDYYELQSCIVELCMRAYLEFLHKVVVSFLQLILLDSGVI